MRKYRKYEFSQYNTIHVYDRILTPKRVTYFSTDTILPVFWSPYGTHREPIHTICTALEGSKGPAYQVWSKLTLDFQRCRNDDYDMGTYKVRNEINTKRNETERNETKTKSNETKRNLKKNLNFNFSVFQIIKTRQDGGHLGFLMKKMT